MQYQGSGLFIMEWERFKELLEIPKSYKAGNIDQQVLNPSKKELLKIGLKITKIEKVKNGRSIDNIKIMFKFEKKKEEKKQDKEPKLVEEQAHEITDFDKELGKLSTELMKKKKVNLIMQLSSLKTVEDIQEFKKKNGL